MTLALGLGLGLSQRGRGGRYSPSILFANGEQGGWYDPSDLTTLFQDAAGTIPVTKSNDIVGLMLDKRFFFGRTTAAMVAIYGSVLAIPGNHATQSATASRPTYKTNGTLSWLAFDGVDDFLVTGAIDFSGKDEVTVFAGLYKAQDAAATVVAELGTNTNTVSGTFSVTAPSNNGSPNFGWASRGAAAIAGAAWVNAAVAAPVTAVVTGLGKPSTNLAAIRVGGVQRQTSGVVQGAMNYLNAPLYIGRRAGTAAAFSGNLYGLIIRGALTADPDLSKAEKWMASKTGVAL